MAAELVRLQTVQDALVVVMNFCPERRERLMHFLRQHFESDREYLYLEPQTFPSADEVAQKLVAERDAYRVLLPENCRLIFCCYVPLSKLTGEWMDHYQAFPKEMNLYLPAKDGAQHCYAAFLQYQIRQMLLQRQGPAIEAALRFAAQENAFPHAQYLVYVPLVDTPDTQEEAMAQLLWVWSRRDGYQVLNPFSPDAVRQLHVVNYASYQESEADKLKERIAVLKKWLAEEADPDLNSLSARAVTQTRRQVRKIMEASARFEELAGFYPARVTDYRRKSFGLKYERAVPGGPDSFLQKCRRGHIWTVCQELLHDTCAEEEIAEWMQGEYHLPDYELLERVLSDGSLRTRIFERTREQGADISNITNEVDALLSDWYLLLEEALRRAMRNYKDKEKEIRLELQKRQNDLARAGRYRDNRDCLQRMAEDVKFMTPTDILPEGIATRVFVAGELAAGWTLEGYDTHLADKVYDCPPNDSADVAVLKEAVLVEMESSDAAALLKLVLH